MGLNQTTLEERAREIAKDVREMSTDEELGGQFVYELALRHLREVAIERTDASLGNRICSYCRTPKGSREPRICTVCGGYPVSFDKPVVTA